MAVDAGERLILRRTAPDRTVDGAVVLDPIPRRFRKRSAARHRGLLQALSADPTPMEALAALALAEPNGIIEQKEAGKRLGLSKAAFSEKKTEDL